VIDRLFMHQPTACLRRPLRACVVCVVRCAAVDSANDNGMTAKNDAITLRRTHFSRDT